MAKAYEPTISEEIKVELIERYIKKRQSSANTIKEGETYITMRSLLAMVRLCQARVHFLLIQRPNYDFQIRSQEKICSKSKK